MLFGLRNATQTFQRFIDEVSTKIHHTATQYIDDILMASRDKEEHQEHLKQLFTRLDNYRVRINPAKCVLGKEKIRFLEYEVSASGTEPLPEKVEAFKNFRKPLTIK